MPAAISCLELLRNFAGGQRKYFSLAKNEKFWEKRISPAKNEKFPWRKKVKILEKENRDLYRE